MLYMGFAALFGFWRFWRHTVKAPVQLAVATAVICIHFFKNAEALAAVNDWLNLGAVICCLIILFGYLQYKLGRRDGHRVVAWFFYLNFVVFICYGSRALARLLDFAVGQWSPAETGISVGLVIGLVVLYPRIASHIGKLRRKS